MSQRDHIYFASDLHLGAPDHASSLIREKHFVKWLDSIQEKAAELFLLGDVFDFWFEYRKAVPRGFVRLLGKLAELSDQGIPIHIFSGNHDLWYKDYLVKEIGAQIYQKPIEREFYGKKYYLAHGDGLGPGDHGYKLMKKVFIHPWSKWLFARLHPNSGIGLAQFMSSKGGDHNYNDLSGEEVHLLGEKEYLHAHARSLIKQREDLDLFIFGHRHSLIDEELEKGKRIIILGDWIQYFSYFCVHPQGEDLHVFPMK
ncbi:MAG: UDP-2,3-diacylglucosamine diphosphatase [Bacteroidota bacterium]